MNKKREITLRPVTRGDEDFLLSVYTSTREQELSLVPWNQEQKNAFVRMQFAAQQEHYAVQYPHAQHDIIFAGGIPVGRIYLDRSGENLHIMDITVLPQFRNSGTGSFVLQQVMEEAVHAEKAVTIYVENYNPSLRLFTRLGFQRVEEQGLHWLLKKLP